MTPWKTRGACARLSRSSAPADAADILFQIRGVDAKLAFKGGTALRLPRNQLAIPKQLRGVLTRELERL